MLGTWDFDFSKQPSRFGLKVAKRLLKTFAAKVFEEKTGYLADRTTGDRFLFSPVVGCSTGGVDWEPGGGVIRSC